MADVRNGVVEHYGAPGLYDRVMSALGASTRDEVTPDMLKPVDEFHVGGVEATMRLLDPLGFDENTTVLDVGSGIGGTARFLNARYGATVTGIDLTPEFVETARRLTELVGLKASFHEGSAFDMPFDDASFDAATLFHVGMNLPDKDRLFAEVARVLRPGGLFAVFDVMLFGAQPAFPQPWATTENESFVEPPELYRAAGRSAGLDLIHRADCREAALAFFDAMRRQQAKGGGPPKFAQTILMGDNAMEKRGNLATAIEAGDIEPVEMVFRKAAA